MKETLSHCSTQQCLPQIPTLDRFAMRGTNPGKLAFLDRKERAFQDRFVPGKKSGCGTQLVPGTDNQITTKERVSIQKRDVTRGVTGSWDHFDVPDLLPRSVDLIDLGSLRSDYHLKHSSET